MAPDEVEIDVSVSRMEYALVLGELRQVQAKAQAARQQVESALALQFQRRVHAMLEQTGGFSLTDAIKDGVPCIDCLGMVTTKTRPAHVFSLRSPDEGHSWGADARCGYRVGVEL